MNLFNSFYLFINFFRPIFTKNKLIMENSEFRNGFIVGWIVGVVIFGVLFFALFQSSEEFKSPTVVTPEKVLTIDGNKVDTTYVYKLNEK